MVTKVHTRMIESATINVRDRGMKEGTNVDNTLAWATILQNVEDGETIDLDGGVYRIFEGINGIPSAGADPAVDRAISEELLPALRNKKNVTIRNGTVYVADQKVAAAKSYFPNTLTIADCENITLDNVSLESKGESYGDADESAPLGRPERHLFLQYNSGNALLISKSKGVIVNGGVFRLCGSVGVIYTSTCSNIQFNSVFANAASLGYAAFAHDSWVGSTGNGFSPFEHHEHTLVNCSSNKETLTARDTANAVGSSTYSTKGCVVIEDEDVKCFINGGTWKDAYPNGSARDNGFAFNANISTMHVSNAFVENCHAVGNTGQSAEGSGILLCNNVVGRNIRHAMHICMPTSFSDQRFHYVNCDIEITGDGVWAGDGNRARENSCYVSNLKAGSTVYGMISNCRLVGATAISINDAVVYGYLKIDNCYIETDGYGILSDGWGGAGVSADGITMRNCQVVDTGTEMDAWMQYTNLDAPSAFTHIFIDFTSSTLRTATERPVYNIIANGTNLVREIFGFDKIYGGYGSNYPARKTHTLKYKEQRGIAGGYRKVVFEFPDRVSFQPRRFNDASVDTGAVNMFNAVSAVGEAVINGDGNLEQEFFVGNTGLVLWTEGDVILCDAMPVTDDDAL